MTVTVTTPANPNDLRRARVRRTVWILFGCAIGSYLLFLYTAMHPR